VDAHVALEICCARLIRRVFGSVSLRESRLVRPGGCPGTGHYDFLDLAGVTSATAASAVSSKNVNVSCR
jgi:hypothetical protein